MPQISAFRGLRYDLGHVGSLEGVVAPSIECIEAAEQKQLYERHPANVVRLIRNRPELGDEPGAAPSRAARFFRNWQREGVLQREPDPALYIYHIVAPSGETTRGMVCLMRIQNETEQQSKPDGDGLVLVHEPGEEEIAERLELLASAEASLAMTVGVYSSLQSDHQDSLEQAIVNVAPIETKDSENRTHRVWPITDLSRINEATSLATSLRVGVVGGNAELVAVRRWLKERDTTEATDLMVCLFESDRVDPDDADTFKDASCPPILNGLVFHSHMA